MKARYLAVCILAVGWIAFFLLRVGPKPIAEAPHTTVQEAKTNASEPLAPPGNKNPPQLLATAKTANDSLAGAYEMATFINQLVDSVPSERAATRDHLRGIQAVFFISDYVMAAKTNSILIVSEPAIVAAFTNVSQNASLLEDRLRLWAVRPGSLTDHYRSISQIPAEKQNLDAIKAALTENGLVVDMENDLLMDCIRYAVHNTGIHEMYGANPKNVNEATPFPAELNSLVSTGDTVFRHRFAEKYGLDPRVITNMMDRIKVLRIYGLSPADVEIPVAHL